MTLLEPLGQKSEMSILKTELPKQIHDLKYQIFILGSVVEIRNGPTFHDSIASEPSFLIDNTLFSRNGD
jgi:hypothetical protein